MADEKKAAAKAAMKEEKAAKRAQRKETRTQLWQAFNMLRKQDKMFLPLVLLAILGLGLVGFLIGLLWGGEWFMLPVGLLFGVLAALWNFTTRLQKSVYTRAEGQPGAAGWALENLRSGVGMVWKTHTAVAATTQMDAVHRVVGVCGIVLVGEGEQRRLKPLMAQQRRRLQRIASQYPVYEIYVGDGEDEVPVAKLQRAMVRLPRNIKKDEVHSLYARLEAMDTQQGNPGLPKGPIPKGGSMSGLNRRARRAADRKKK